MRIQNFLVLSSLPILLSGCLSGNFNYETPRDELGDMCTGHFINTPSKCVDSRFTNSNYLAGGFYTCGTFFEGAVDRGDGSEWVSGYFEPYFQSDSPVNPSCVWNAPIVLNPEPTDALILVTEPGLANANAENLRSMLSGFPQQLIPHFRTLQNNTLSAFFKRLLETSGRRYGRIYLVRSDSESKSLLLGAIRRVSAAHRSVDMLLTIHGSYSAWQLSPDLSTQLSSAELVSFASQLPWSDRNKIRAIFSTACFGSNSYLGQSMANALATAFPSSVNYGSIGVNYAPMHRDLVAFESFYKGNSFASAIQLGNSHVRYNLATGAPRTQLNPPAILGRGCFSYIIGKHCENQTIKLNPFALSEASIYNGEASLTAGASGDLNVRLPASFQNVGGPIHRFYHPPSGNHLLTLNYNEGILAGYLYEGVAFVAQSTQATGTRPLYRCRIGGDHFVSQQSNCEGYIAEGLYGYVSASAGSGLVPLYRRYNGRDHFATIHATEGNPHYWTEFILGYVSPIGVTSPTPPPPPPPAPRPPCRTCQIER